jgi:hypothetical protein
MDSDATVVAVAAAVVVAESLPPVVAVVAVSPPDAAVVELSDVSEFAQAAATRAKTAIRMTMRHRFKVSLLCWLPTGCSGRTLLWIALQGLR